MKLLKLICVLSVLILLSDLVFAKSICLLDGKFKVSWNSYIVNASEKLTDFTIHFTPSNEDFSSSDGWFAVAFNTIQQMVSLISSMFFNTIILSENNKYNSSSCFKTLADIVICQNFLNSSSAVQRFTSPGRSEIKLMKAGEPSYGLSNSQLTRKSSSYTCKFTKNNSQNSENINYEQAYGLVAYGPITKGNILKRLFLFHIFFS